MVEDLSRTLFSINDSENNNVLNIDKYGNINILENPGEGFNRITLQDKINSIGANVISTTYSNLVQLRNSSELIPGVWYRITDYECTTTQEDTRSAGNQFDILVLATSENTLSESGCKAIQHEGDTYFKYSKLEAWQIWYCLDNDVHRFAWADASNGKGVIYRMIDEFENDVPYDFKNIQFKCYEYKGFGDEIDIINRKLTSKVKEGIDKLFTEKADDSCYFVIDDKFIGADNVNINTRNVFKCGSKYIFRYTFSNHYPGEYIDASIPHDYSMKFGEYSIQYGLSSAKFPKNNIIKPYNLKSYYDDDEYYVQMLNFNMFINYYDDYESIKISNNTLGYNCHHNIFGAGFENNIIGNECIGNYFYGYVHNNVIHNNFKRNLIMHSPNTNASEGIKNNIFGNHNYNNIIYSYLFEENIFGNNINGNTFLECSSNIFNNDFKQNYISQINNSSFGIYVNNCDLNVFCDSITFANHVENLIINTHLYNAKIHSASYYNYNLNSLPITSNSSISYEIDIYYKNKEVFVKMYGDN